MASLISSTLLRSALDRHPHFTMAIGVLCLALLCAPWRTAHAADVLLIDGQGNDVTIRGLALRMPAWKSWGTPHGWRYALANEYQLGLWHGRQRAAEDRQLFDGSVSAVLTVRAPERMAWAPYLEAGFGGHLISRTHIDTDREFSTAFQFGEFLGLGTDIGERNQYSLAARIQHVSNGSIHKPNDGVTFSQLVVQYRF